MSPDIVNALFELGGAAAVLMSVRKAVRDRLVSGVSAAHVVFFTLWGAWNVYFYPHLGQWWSFVAGVVLLLANIAYAVAWVRYTEREAQP